MEQRPSALQTERYSIVTRLLAIGTMFCLGGALGRAFLFVPWGVWFAGAIVLTMWNVQEFWKMASLFERDRE